jgi:phospholipid/cholesterol/gamma-HCH transport system permease protein
VILRQILLQIYFTGVQPVMFLGSISFLVGGFVMAQSSDQLTKIGGIGPLGHILVFANLRDIVPLIVLMIVIGRSVTAITSELASMKVQNEIRLYRAFNVSVDKIILFPRLIGPAVGTFCVSWVCVAMGFLGAFVMAVTAYRMDPLQFWHMCLQSIKATDLAFWGLKTVLISVVIFLIAVREGGQLWGASFEIPIVTLRAVIRAYMSAFILFAIISLSYYLIEGIRF